MKDKFSEWVWNEDIYHGMFLNGQDSQKAISYIQSTLNPFVTNKSRLASDSAWELASTAINVNKINSNSSWAVMLRQVLFCYENSLANKQTVFKIIALWQKEIARRQTESTQFIRLNSSDDNLPLDGFRLKILNHIGNTVEATTQPFLREFLCIIRNLDSSDDIKKIKDLSLGSLISEAEKEFTSQGFSVLQNLIAPQPWGITLSQWRNITQHLSSYVQEDKIICEYGKNKSISLSKQEVSNVAREIYYRLGILKTARDIFIFNNFDEISKIIDFKVEDPDSLLLNLTHRFSAFGFKIVEAKDLGDGFMVEIEPLKNDTEKKIIKTCVQLLLHVYYLFPSKDAGIMYHNKSSNNTHLICSSAKQLNEFVISKKPVAELYKIAEITKTVHAA